MSQLESFSVQKCIFDGIDVLAENCVHVEALSPLHAGEIALGQRLAANGPVEFTRARVWKLGDDFSPTSVMLYEAVDAD
jgi:hypothetical protein